MEIAALANLGEQKISALDTVDIIVKRLLGITLDAIAKFHGVSKQTILYHESKERTRGPSGDFTEACG